jgi:hypothetical protein
MAHSHTIVYNFLYKHDSLTLNSVQLSVQTYCTLAMSIVKFIVTKLSLKKI